MLPARRVAVYRSALLPPSETFIKAQACALRRWQPVLVGDQHVAPSLTLEGLPHVLAHRGGGTLQRGLHRLDGAVERRAGISLATCVALASQRVKLVHAHFGTEGIRVWPAARALHLPLLVTLHGFDIMIDEPFWETYPDWRLRHYPARLRALSRRKRVHFVAVSDAVRARALGFGIAPEKIETAYIGVDVARFAPRGKPAGERAREVLFVGRLVEKKGTPLLLEAFARVHAALPDARLVIAGDGPERAALHAAVAGADLPITLLGDLAPEQVSARLTEARVFCLPSVVAASGDAEGLPIVLLEAQASGVPVVTSSEGGNSEAMRHGESGLAHAPGDVAALAAHLIRLLSDDALCTRLGAGGRAHVCARFDIHACTRKLEALYDRMLA